MKAARAKTLQFVPFVLTLVLTSNCVRQRPAPQILNPQPSGKLFAIDHIEHKLYEIASRSSGRGVEYRPLAENVLSAAVSPNQKALLYYLKPPGPPGIKDDQLVLRDLLTGQEKVIIKGVPALTLSWSTDSQRFSYVSQNDIHVADLAGKSRLVYQAPHAKYSLTSTSGTPMGAKEMYAPFARPRWFGSDRFWFQRYVGELPYYPALAWNELFVQPNTATIAVVAGAPRLVDLEKKWVMRGVCPDQSLLLLGEDFRQGRLYIGSAKSDLKQSDLRELPESTTRDDRNLTADLRKYDFLMGGPEAVRFNPRNCQLCYLRTEGAEKKHARVSFIDPATLAERSTFELNDVGEIISWIFDADGRNIALVHKSGALYSLSIVNLETGAKSTLDSYGIPGGSSGLGNWSLLGWVR